MNTYTVTHRREVAHAELTLFLSAAQSKSSPGLASMLCSCCWYHSSPHLPSRSSSSSSSSSGHRLWEPTGMRWWCVSSSSNWLKSSGNSIGTWLMPSSARLQAALGVNEETLTQRYILGQWWRRNFHSLRDSVWQIRRWGLPPQTSYDFQLLFCSLVLQVILFILHWHNGKQRIFGNENIILIWVFVSYKHPYNCPRKYWRNTAVNLDNRKSDLRRI